jgi:hypothetical protein
LFLLLLLPVGLMFLFPSLQKMALHPIS